MHLQPRRGVVVYMRLSVRHKSYEVSTYKFVREYLAKHWVVGLIGPSSLRSRAPAS
jgi:hypothetical protein